MLACGQVDTGRCNGREGMGSGRTLDPCAPKTRLFPSLKVRSPKGAAWPRVRPHASRLNEERTEYVGSEGGAFEGACWHAGKLTRVDPGMAAGARDIMGLINGGRRPCVTY